MRLLLSILVAMLMVQTVSAQALWRNYWTTNRYPQNASSLTNLQATNITGTIPPTAIATNTPSANQVLTATSAGSAKWDILSPNALPWDVLRSPPTTNAFCFLGDSLSTPGTWVDTFITIWPNMITSTNFATDGWTSSDLYSSYSTNGHGFVTNNAKAVVSVEIGSNDFYYGSNATQVIYNISNIWNAVQSDGGILWAWTIMPRGDVPINWTEWNTVNTWIRQSTNWSYLLDAARMFPVSTNGDYVDTFYVHQTTAAKARTAYASANMLTSQGRGGYDSETSPTALVRRLSPILVDTVYGGVAVSNVHLWGVDIGILPASVPVGTTAFCTNTYTPYGVGGVVTFDGTNWMTEQRVIASSNLVQFGVNCFHSGLNVTTPRLTSFFTGPVFTPQQSILPRYTTYSTGASVNGPWGGSVYGSHGRYYTGTDAGQAGSSRAFGMLEPAIEANWVYGVCGSYSVSAASTTTDTYWCFIGMDDGQASAFPANGVGFLYDLQNTNAHNLPDGTNWIAMTAGGSARSYSSTGLGVSLTPSAKTNKLAVFLTSTAAYFFTNGVLATTITTNIPQQPLYMNRTYIQRTVGTSNSRYLAECGVGLFIWHPMYDY